MNVSKKAMLSKETLAALPDAALAGLTCECAASGDLEQMKALVAAGVSVNNATPYDKRTPLHLAAAAGHIDMVQFLVKEQRCEMQRDRFGLLPIHDAVENGHSDVRRFLQDQKLQAEASGKRRRLNSYDAHSSPLEDGLDEKKSTVFELAVKEGVFGYSTVHAEVEYFFRDLNLHPIYFTHFTPFQIAKHIHCLIAAKRVTRATDDMSRMDFVFKTETNAFFLSPLDKGVANEALLRTEAKIDDFIESCRSDGILSFSLTFMASDGAAFKGGKQRLGIWSADRVIFQTRRSNLHEGASSLDELASERFLKEKTRIAKEQYQIVMEDAVSTQRAATRLVSGDTYPGPFPGGWVLLFGTSDTAARNYFKDVCQALRFVALTPKRFYVETFLNGVITYALFFPTATKEEVQKLEASVLYSTLLSSSGRSIPIYQNVMSSRISHEVGLYLQAAVKFVYSFFPKEQYCRDYLVVHKVLENDSSSQRKLEALYKLCMKELLSLDRIFDLVLNNLPLAILLYEDFRRIALGENKPGFNEDIAKVIVKSCQDDSDRQIFNIFLRFNASLLMTNFFKPQTPGALAFCLNPAIVLKDRPASLYPEVPYRIYLVSGRNFFGFHVRFRDVARGGIRIVLSQDRNTHDRNFATLIDECYNLAYTQQNKNKDIPEGGAKGIILPNVSWKTPAERDATAKTCFTHYIDALLDCMMPTQSQIYDSHMNGRIEYLYFGPDENTAGFMDAGALLAKSRGYQYWKALTTGKSVKLGGVPHDTYGMTTCSVHTYVVELLKTVGVDEASITKFQTGGPDGDLGSNEILMSKDKTIGIADGSGVLYDPFGLNRDELLRLARKRIPVRHFNRSLIGTGGFLVTTEDTDITLPDGSQWLSGVDLRNEFHLTNYSTADLFVPCGGRPNAVNGDNVGRLFHADGRPRFKFIVEGANLFFSDHARSALEKAGVHLFKDASTNKGGVNSSSLEVLAALAMNPADHTADMTYNPDEAREPPEFYVRYVQDILSIISENAQQEFHGIWQANQKDGLTKLEASKRISSQINSVADSIQAQFKHMTDAERTNLIHNVLTKSLPPSILERMGVAGVVQNVPANYIQATVAAWIASRFVYKHGFAASEVSFFFFMRSLLDSPSNPGVANGAAKN